MANTTSPSSLNPREAVADALYRCVLGIDNNDHAMFKSGCLTDESIIITAGPIALKGWTEIDAFFQRLFVKTTTHITSNVRVELEDGADTASMTAHAIAYHMRPEDAITQEDASYTAGNLYFIDLVRDSDEGLWKIKKWDIKVLWTTGDRAVLHG